MHIIILKARKLLWITLLAVLLFGLVVFYNFPHNSVAVAVNTPPIKLPILMYHSILKDPVRTGDYVITPARLEEDMVYLKQEGYTTILVSDLIRFVDSGEPLPSKPIMLTFDDGYYNNLIYLLPLLKKHEMKAVISVVGSLTDRFSKTADPNPYYAHLTWDDIATLQDSGFIEIQNHSYDLHTHDTKRRGSKITKNESVTAYKKMLSEDISALQYELYNKLGICPTAFAYPFGEICPEALTVLKEIGFRAAFTCYEKNNYLTGTVEELFHLNRFNRQGQQSTADFMTKIK